MLVIKCGACKKKLWRYDKIGPGELLRCHKSRIDKMYQPVDFSGRVCCKCGNAVGIDKGRFIKMIPGAFSFSGTWRSG
ncbi:MAG: hypothetical protein R6X08_11845 [Desulfosalsimonadaceae bacterium]